MKLLVRNLARTTTEHDIRKLFSEHGSVTECTLVLDQETGNRSIERLCFRRNARCFRSKNGNCSAEYDKRCQKQDPSQSCSIKQILKPAENAGFLLPKNCITPA